MASIFQGSRVLEVGTATGRFAASLTQRGAEYTGVDLSQRMLRATFKRTKHSASLIQMDGSKLGFRHYFDHVLCIRTFHFLQKPVEVLQGMFSALKPGGEALVTFETDNFLRRLLLYFGIGTSEQYYYKISDVQDMFLKAGFKVGKKRICDANYSNPLPKMPEAVSPYIETVRKTLALANARVCWPMHEYVLGVKF